MQSLRSEMSGRFSDLNARFSEVNSRFGEMNSRLTSLEGRVTTMWISTMALIAAGVIVLVVERLVTG